MRKLAIAVALASTTLATPAFARDHSGYVGLEAGGMIVEDTRFDFDNNDDLFVDNGVEIGHKVGFDIDLVGGYDFGAFRLEAELGYKHASVDEIGFDDQLQLEQLGGFFDADGSVKSVSGMINALVDFGGDDGWSGYLGGGVGLASVKYNSEVDDALFGTPGSPLPEPPLTSFDVSDSDSGFAWQLIAGVRAPISANIDLGLKYRFFNAGRISLNGDANEGDFDLTGKWRSHSLLASLIYNFAAPPPPPSPPPPPPPPPPPAPERG